MRLCSIIVSLSDKLTLLHDYLKVSIHLLESKLSNEIDSSIGAATNTSKESDEAIKILEKARNLAPENANILFELEKALSGSTNHKKLEDVSKVLKEIDPDGVAAGKCKMAC